MVESLCLSAHLEKSRGFLDHLFDLTGKSRLSRIDQNLGTAFAQKDIRFLRTRGSRVGSEDEKEVL